MNSSALYEDLLLPFSRPAGIATIPGLTTFWRTTIAEESGHTARLSNGLLAGAMGGKSAQYPRARPRQLRALADAKQSSPERRHLRQDRARRLQRRKSLFPVVS